ncbi:hypothetical protein AO364_1212 [Moraxella catarrhalis]|uniref:transcriptional regulator n=1 Tax=Moraxella catarrhalis TaxID=480 RepID=UPI0007E81A2F|nr:Cro/CI family transcriptional regulator [Moraxella catarrhalis]OAV36044.1 hypothetical protein AO364_1212 [Moraxella catarrhalis]
MKQKEIVKDLIAYFGTQTKLAEAIGVSQGTVTGWLNGTHGIRESNALKIEIVTQGQFKAIDLNPSLAKIKELKKAKTLSGY